MNKRVCLLVRVIFVMLAACSNQPDAASETARIEQLIREYNQAFDRGDITEFAQYCTADMEFYTLDGRALKNPEFICFLSPMFSRWSNLNTEISDLEIEVSGNFAYAKYHTKFTFMSRNNNQEMNNLLTVIFRKYGDDWKIVHYHMSTRE